MKRSRVLLIVAVIFAALCLGALHYSYTHRASVKGWGIGNPDPTVMIGGALIHVALAVTPAQREQGLSGTHPLASDRGMLFIFPDDGQYRFWMKDMNYSLDIIWISSDGRIVYIARDLAPSTYPNSYGPEASARYVLEVSAGFAAVHGVKIGDQVGL